MPNPYEKVAARLRMSPYAPKDATCGFDPGEGGFVATVLFVMSLCNLTCLYTHSIVSTVAFDKSAK